MPIEYIIYKMNIYIYARVCIYMYSFSSVAEFKFYLLDLLTWPVTDVYKVVIKSIFLSGEWESVNPCFKYLSNADNPVFCVLIIVVIFMKKVRVLVSC